jgi:hypothetical protein
MEPRADCEGGAMNSATAIEEDGDEIFISMSDVRCRAGRECSGEKLVQVDGYMRCPVCNASYGFAKRRTDGSDSRDHHPRQNDEEQFSAPLTTTGGAA